MINYRNNKRIWALRFSRHNGLDLIALTIGILLFSNCGVEIGNPTSKDNNERPQTQMIASGDYQKAFTAKLNQLSDDDQRNFALGLSFKNVSDYNDFSANRQKEAIAYEPQGEDSGYYNDAYCEYLALEYGEAVEPCFGIDEGDDVTYEETGESSGEANTANTDGNKTQSTGDTTTSGDGSEINTADEKETSANGSEIVVDKNLAPLEYCYAIADKYGENPFSCYIYEGGDPSIPPPASEYNDAATDFIVFNNAESIGRCDDAPAGDEDGQYVEKCYTEYVDVKTTDGSDVTYDQLCTASGSSDETASGEPIDNEEPVAIQDGSPAEDTRFPESQDDTTTYDDYCTLETETEQISDWWENEQDEPYCLKEVSSQDIQDPSLLLPCVPEGNSEQICEYTYGYNGNLQYVCFDSLDPLAWSEDIVEFKFNRLVFGETSELQSLRDQVAGHFNAFDNFRGYGDDTALAYSKLREASVKLITKYDSDKNGWISKEEHQRIYEHLLSIFQKTP